MTFMCDKNRHIKVKSTISVIKIDSSKKYDIETLLRCQVEVQMGWFGLNLSEK